MKKLRQRQIWKMDHPRLLTIPGYCPYCNKTQNPKILTLEHVIPRAIQPHNNITIMVCKQCNDFMGHNVDILISRQTVLRLLGTSSHSHATVQERHKTHARLKDGTVLEGYLIVLTAHGKANFTFEPLKRQLDGTKWISVEVARKATSLPSEIRILDRNDVKEIEFPLVIAPEDIQTLGPAFAKIFLGFAYCAWGYKALSTAFFEPLRDLAHGRAGVNIGRVKVGMDGLVEDGDIRLNPPKQLTFPNHLLWGEAFAGRLIGGISLFAKATVYVTLDEFDLNLSGQSAEITNNFSGLKQLVWGTSNPPTYEEVLKYAKANNIKDS